MAGVVDECGLRKKSAVAYICRPGGGASHSRLRCASELHSRVARQVASRILFPSRLAAKWTSSDSAQSSARPTLSHEPQAIPRRHRMTWARSRALFDTVKRSSLTQYPRWTCYAATSQRRWMSRMEATTEVEKLLLDTIKVCLLLWFLPYLRPPWFERLLCGTISHRSISRIHYDESEESHILYDQ